MIDEMPEAWQEGYHAYFAHKHIDANPYGYELAHMSWWNWKAGWMGARAEHQNADINHERISAVDRAVDYILPRECPADFMQKFLGRDYYHDDGMNRVGHTLDADDVNELWVDVWNVLMARARPA